MNFNKKTIIIFFIIIIISVILTAYFYIYSQFYTPVSGSDQTETFIVKSGEGVRQIAEHLEEQGLVGSSFYFKLYVWKERLTKKLQAGEYLFQPNMNIKEMVNVFVQGEVVSREIQVTVPEGFTVKQIELKLIETGLLKEGGLAVFSNFSQYRQTYDFLENLPDRGNLEGFLFPDTYKFYKDTTPKEILEKMLDNFDKKITNQLREEIKNQNKTIFEIITLASIVQNEAASKDEMKTIAGVLNNRLKRNYPLQSDATLNYVTGKNLRQPTIEDTKIKSPYNTYLNVGLPPGPISSPGIEAILASIYPEDTDYFYFLHPLDSPAIFSKTFEEHSINKAKYLK